MIFMVALNKIFEILPNQLPMGVVIADTKDKIIFINEQAQSDLEVSWEAKINKSILDCHHGNVREKVKQNLARFKTGENLTWKLYSSQGNRFFKNVYNGIYDEKREYLGSILMMVDITEQMLVQDRLKESNNKLLALFNATKVINSSLDLDLVLEKILEIAIKVSYLDSAGIYLFKEGQLMLASCLPTDCTDINSTTLVDIQWSEATKLAMQGIPHYGEIDNLIPLKAGKEVIGLLHGHSKKKIESDTDESDMLIALGNQAAIAVKNALVYQEISEMAIIDSLTGLYNRKHFYDIYAIETERMQRDTGVLGAIMIDINHLKKVNDNLGHLMGDYYIKEAARIVKENVRKVDYVFRFGGDEILALCPNTDEKGLQQIEQRIRSEVNHWNSDKEEEILSLSIGWSIAKDQLHLAKLIEEADTLMYEDKRKYYSSRNSKDI